MNSPRQRFYREASIGPRLTEGYAILLDGKPVRTPAGKPLALANREVAEAVATEWNAQESKIDPDKMMLTKLANTAIDRIAPDRSEAIRQIVAFGRSDLLCYRAQAPDDLVRRQDRVWNPLLDWASATYGIELERGAGVGYIEQPRPATAALEEALSHDTDLWLAACLAATTLTGSAIIALALAVGHMDASQAFAAAQLDEDYQAERWGRDEEAERRKRKKSDELTAIAHLFELLRS